jgi:hypothetical protein
MFYLFIIYLSKRNIGLQKAEIKDVDRTAVITHYNKT